MGEGILGSSGVYSCRQCKACTGRRLQTGSKVPANLFTAWQVNKNSTVYLNMCKLLGSSKMQSWISKNQSRSLLSGLWGKDFNCLRKKKKGWIGRRKKRKRITKVFGWDPPSNLWHRRQFHFISELPLVQCLFKFLSLSLSLRNSALSFSIEPSVFLSPSENIYLKN